MNKKNKIIVSIVGITIVLLALLGITYAYYLTRIEGNTNTNSISVTTAKLELVYGDNSAEIIQGSSALVPDSDNPIGTKTFTVTNNGTDSSYVVIIDNVSIKNVSDNSNTNFLSNDFRYTLTCKKRDNTNCNEVSDLTQFPINGGILVGNNIDEGDVHTYTLTMWYIDTGIDQSDDMGKSYQARVNITNSKDTTNGTKNIYMTGISFIDSKNLAYNLINNAKENKNSTKLLSEPLTNPATEITFKLSDVEDEFEMDLEKQSILYYGNTYKDAQPWNGGSVIGTVAVCDDKIVKNIFRILLHKFLACKIL